ncbi:Phospholipase D/Transphosphatidylase [Sesbania bispinosa]|nr:Phospholipase D/Transphosphatidylase [Sesbania bispinosa]
MPQLLHGTLKVTINEVDRLHTGCNLDFLQKGTTHKTKRFLAQVKGCLLCRPEARVARTRMIGNQPSNPKWKETFEIYCAHNVSNIIFTVKDGNPIGATLIGRAYVPANHVIKGPIINRWVEIIDDEDHRPVRGHSKICVSVQFTSVTEDKKCQWSQGICMPFMGVPRTFFNQREGCNVTLYQDAHAPDNALPWIPISGTKYYVPGRCWEDIYNAIVEAKYFIYITGWSVYTEITLIRDAKNLKTSVKLGELLKMKADEGVNVLMLVWDDRTSVPDLEKDGLMATHDQETADYFRNTKVHCVLCPRDPGGGRSMVQGFQISTMFTHHQKTIILDSKIEGLKKRKVISFIGGLDLCDGRYDTREHPLFSTLNTVHHDDFHQPNFPSASIKKGGPREPWHDIHCKLEGPIAWDVLYNFEQRWEKQAGKEFQQFLFPLDVLDRFLVHPSEAVPSEDGDMWNVQLFRSIDGGAVSNFPQAPDEVAELGLVSGKNNIIDRSIQDAYINAIRRAKNFIYIENQYFLGSSYGWKPSESVSDIKIEDINALHLIPKELSLKIVSKIEAGERFVVYVVIPMWPEGVPESVSVQVILGLQRRTMEMMYSDIADAIKKKNIEAHPRDYLTFFCLGKRERKTEGEYIPPEEPEPDSDYQRAQNARRFMIYVHSKMMIVDDEYIIIGSANINQRSMDGGRDTEIAMGAFQPHHLTSLGPKRPQGQIYGFRRALWYEHIGDSHEAFDEPESEECVKLVNGVAEMNWELYSKDTLDESDQPVHLLRYPIEVAKDGTITTLPGHEFFPDTKAPILGSQNSNFLPPILTT